VWSWSHLKTDHRLVNTSQTFEDGSSLEQLPNGSVLLKESSQANAELMDCAGGVAGQKGGARRTARFPGSDRARQQPQDQPPGSMPGSKLSPSEDPVDSQSADP
jgi:hypothetical protein